ncbi:hypothetical protein B7494_g4423 [Chlorociboria aeruginascens]|nr:hypothetical protein B7494_g4423 [Chlorociboria aeruginascens]
MAGHNRRRSSIDRASVESILTSGDQPSTSPSARVGCSSNRALFDMMPPPRRPTTQHTRAQSYNPRRPNRLSLSFPVATNIYDPSRGTPTSSTSSFPPTPIEKPPVPSPHDPNGFLVALAGQERRVLELKEELEKAENELHRLKKQWAHHEASKKRAEIRHVEPLQQLQTGMEGRTSDESDSSLRQSIELDRRKALLTAIPKDSRRKVITGGHTRTLSLLSPDRSNYAIPFPPVRESSREGRVGIPKSTTMPDTSQGITRVTSSRARHSYQGGVTNGAKQIAEDVKAGLWTFLEDLRQATVGDEGVNGTTSRSNTEVPYIGPKKKSSKSNLLMNERGRRSPKSERTWNSLTGTNSALLDAAGTLWQDEERSQSPAKPVSMAHTPAKALSLTPAVLDDDDWSNWDSPMPAKSPTRWSGSSTQSDQEPATPHNKDDRLVNIIDQDQPNTPSKREEIQWPALDKLTPSNLKRTVSTIMTEWEKSLTPPPEERSNPLSKTNSRSTITDKAKDRESPTRKAGAL